MIASNLRAMLAAQLLRRGSCSEMISRKQADYTQTANFFVQFL
jgi:hypothetical protein